MDEVKFYGRMCIWLSRCHIYEKKYVDKKIPGYEVGIVLWTTPKFHGYVERWNILSWILMMMNRIIKDSTNMTQKPVLDNRQKVEPMSETTQGEIPSLERKENVTRQGDNKNTSIFRRTDMYTYRRE
ncbi:hypothetical protein RvY_10786 [Ramazzottius varieornatus]|uniref:Uncharacterized protein n=1 Tax=Ramazzottius varieornatus TaxID=947166 RepID=A0A1D1VDX8_RAMVA|nr:hypothetical protein RvY_10786 [Ramazzottius varieornatus]